jgi:hypothetical protein
MRTSPASLFGLVVLVSMPLASVVTAEVHQFPYEAVVQTGEVEVRSGPGQRYYVTGRIKLNDKVTVHRHDPGGWYMVAPPVGSFSWIDAGVVEVPLSEGPSARAIVRIGSEFSDDHAYYGRELTTGDEVRILGEKTLTTDRGALRMYQIAPPPLEYRWVKGDFIVPADGSAAPRDLFSANSPAVTQSGVVNAGWQTETVRQPAVQTSYATSAAVPPASVVAVNPAKHRMAEIDQRYVEMTRQQPEQWDLDRLQADYEAIRPQADSAMSRQIDQRLDAIAARRKIWTDWQDFARLTSETSQRDAALLAMQTGGVEGGVAVPSGGPVLAAPAPGSIAPGQNPAANAFATTTVVPGPQVTPRLDGAGIVQRMPSTRRGYAIHVLTDAQGRVLARLEAGPGINLDQQVGRPTGVVGQRSFDPSVQTDVIVVRQILPVQLTP